MAVTDRDGKFILGGLPRHPVWLTLGRPLDQVLKEKLPADRDEVELTYRPSPTRRQEQAALVEDESIPPELPPAIDVRQPHPVRHQLPRRRTGHPR